MTELTWVAMVDGSETSGNILPDKVLLLTHASPMAHTQVHQFNAQLPAKIPQRNTLSTSHWTLFHARRMLTASRTKYPQMDPLKLVSQSTKTSSHMLVVFTSTSLVMSLEDTPLNC